MESFPLVLLLGLLLSLSTLSLGLAGVERLKRMEERERSLQGLRFFLEEVRALSFSHRGNEREVELELGRGELLVLGEKVEAWLEGEKVGEGISPLPLFPSPLLLREGRYLLRLGEGKVLVLPVSPS
ncbi:MAG: hypothetical protein NQU48_02230 [Hadesarchaea archaeon]|jgi:hypothetical protein|nr:hypothetical protein [Hadesarchaea archaeon]